MYLAFDSWPRLDLNLSVFDSRLRGQQPELVAVKNATEDDQVVQRATVLIPDGKVVYFLSRFEEYRQGLTKKRNPRHASFVERIADIKLATVESLWTESEDFPVGDDSRWWEVWLRNRNGREFERLSRFCGLRSLEIEPSRLIFDNRIVALVRATAADLAIAMDVLGDLAELRSVSVTDEYFTPGFEIHSQQVDDLVSRIEAPTEPHPYICILDTGVNRGHPLLQGSLLSTDVHACDVNWFTDDIDGHGTKMAGLALFLDLDHALKSAESVKMAHGLESVKILKSSGMRGNFGALTGSAVQMVEDLAADRRRSFSLSINTRQYASGAPTSWSATLDGLAVGRNFDSTEVELKALGDGNCIAQRLFVVAAGNIEKINPGQDALARSDVEPVRVPAQAWNALTVGAYTELTDVSASGPDFDGWTPMAPAGELSPFSTTSVGFERIWPIKPDVVLEGGNLAESPDSRQVASADSIMLVTTSAGIPSQLLTTTNATSAATAQASWLAARITAAYPRLWPETIRALIVHSAEWTPVMLQHFSKAGNGRARREALLRRYGFGVPDEARAVWSAKDVLTLIVEDSLHPFAKGGFDEMHIHELPWPVSALQQLLDKTVKLRVTLSYFVEPNLAARGWQSRFQYASHGLRFHMKHPHENDENFRKRLNKEALGPREARPLTGEDPGWYFGAHARSRGSIHSDFWEGTAVELAARNHVAVIPVTGWWKEDKQRDKSHLGVRYSLIVSISTQEETADLWTPVSQQVVVPTQVET